MKQLFYIKGNNFTDSQRPVLSLEIGERHFGFAITDEAASQLHCLAYYSDEEIDAESLASVFSEHTELFRSFHSVQVCYDHARNALVPDQYVTENALQPLLDIMHGKNGQSRVITESITGWQMHNLYAVPGSLREWIDRKFPSAVCRHHFTLGLRSLQAGPADRICVDIHSADFSYFAIRDNKLVIAQSQPYSSPEDVCFQLLKTCHQYSFSQQEVLLQVSGLVDRESQLYRELYQFFVNVEFRETGWIAPDPGEHELPAHFFTTLNDLARCAS